MRVDLKNFLTLAQIKGYVLCPNYEGDQTLTYMYVSSPSRNSIHPLSVQQHRGSSS